MWHYSGKVVAQTAVEKRAVARPATMDLPAVTDHELYQVISRPVLPANLCPAPDPLAGIPGGGGSQTDSGKKNKQVRCLGIAPRAQLL